MGVTEEAGRVTMGFMDALKREPLSLALVVMNLCLLVFFYLLLTTIATQREREVGLLYADKKEVREMLAKCIVPQEWKKMSYVTPLSLLLPPSPLFPLVPPSPLLSPDGKE